jgi:hypothetical protein
MIPERPMQSPPDDRLVDLAARILDGETIDWARIRLELGTDGRLTSLGELQDILAAHVAGRGEGDRRADTVLDDHVLLGAPVDDGLFEVFRARTAWDPGPIRFARISPVPGITTFERAALDGDVLARVRLIVGVLGSGSPPMKATERGGAVVVTSPWVEMERPAAVDAVHAVTKVARVAAALHRVGLGHGRLDPEALGWMASEPVVLEPFPSVERMVLDRLGAAGRLTPDRFPPRLMDPPRAALDLHPIGRLMAWLAEEVPVPVRERWRALASGLSPDTGGLDDADDLLAELAALDRSG